MVKIYGKGAGDPDWPASGKSRRGGTSYLIVDDNLEVKKPGSEDVYTLEQNKETIIQIVTTINELQAQRERKALNRYQDGLCRYLTSIMRRVAGYYKGTAFRLVEKTLEDYESRVENGFDHDLKGRELWKLWKERTEAAEDETTSGNAAALEGAGNNPEVTSSTSMLPLWRDEQDLATPLSEEIPVQDLEETLNTPGEEQDAPVEERLPTPSEEQSAPVEERVSTSSEEQDALVALPFISPPPTYESPRKVLTEGIERLQLNLDLDQTHSSYRAIHKLPSWAKQTAAVVVAPGLGLKAASPQLPAKQPEQNALKLQLLASLTPHKLDQEVQQAPEQEQVVLQAPSGSSKQGKTKAVDPLLQLSNQALGPSGSGKAKRRAADPLPQPAKKSMAHGFMLSAGKDGRASNTKGTKQHVAMLSAGKNGLLLKEDVRPAKRLKTKADEGTPVRGLAHKLWDALNAVKSHSEDKPTMTKEKLLELIREVLALAKEKEEPRLKYIMSSLGDWDEYFLPVEGLTSSELTAWNKLKALHLEVTVGKV